MFSLNALNSVIKNYLKILRIAVFEPTISCFRDRDDAPVPQRHRKQIRNLN